LADPTWTNSDGTVNYVDCYWLEEVVIGELLEKAGAGEDSRAELKLQIEWARLFYYDICLPKIPSMVYGKIERAAGELLKTLNKLGGQLPLPSSSAAVSPLLEEVDPKLCELLHDLRRKAANSAKLAAKRGQPEKAGKLQVVQIAADFFRAHSRVKPSTDENNPFRHFAERFFEAATSTEPLNLEWQVRQVLRDKGPREKQRKKND
jgi:hypothetical protein